MCSLRGECGRFLPLLKIVADSGNGQRGSDTYDENYRGENSVDGGAAGMCCCGRQRGCWAGNTANVTLLWLCVCGSPPHSFSTDCTANPAAKRGASKNQGENEGGREGCAKDAVQFTANTRRPVPAACLPVPALSPLCSRRPCM